MTLIQNIKNEFQKQNYLTILIIANVSIFLIINISIHILGLPQVLSLLSLPLNPEKIIAQPWSVITYMFVHQDFGHLFFNMLLLFFTGRLFTTFLNEKKLLYLYMMSGVVAGVFLIILGFIFPEIFIQSFLFGASAATLGIVCFIGIYAPNMMISLFGIFEMKYKYFAITLFIITSIIDFTINTGGKLSHLAGGLFGLAYGYSIKQGHDFLNFSFLPKKKKSPLKIVYKRNVSDEEYNAQQANNQQVIDDLLDKISKKGYDSLSKSEKELLFKLSQKK